MSTGVVSNALLCFVVARQCSRRTLSNSGPTPRNLYIVNLAIADLGLCVLVMPFTLVSLLRTRWTLGVLLCKLVPVAQGTNITVSAGTITAIALDRLVASTLCIYLNKFNCIRLENLRNMMLVISKPQISLLITSDGLPFNTYFTRTLRIFKEGKRVSQ